jgi:RHS repeat-associated protein
LLLSAGSTNFVYGPNNQVIEQEDNSSDGAPQFLVHDQLGSTRLLVDLSGTVDMTATYDAYGNGTPSGSATTPIEYAGGYTDSETGFLYLVNRYYDPATAQFVTVDPLVDETGQAFSYAGDDPVNASDPSGLICWGLCTFTNAAHYVAKHKVAIGLIVVGVVAVVGATLLTGGLADFAAIAAADAEEAGGVSALLESSSVFHAAFVYGPGVVVGALGAAAYVHGIDMLFNPPWDSGSGGSPESANYSSYTSSSGYGGNC